jgi:hypothetical protein
MPMVRIWLIQCVQEQERSTGLRVYMIWMDMSRFDELQLTSAEPPKQFFGDSGVLWLDSCWHGANVSWFVSLFEFCTNESQLSWNKVDFQCLYPRFQRISPIWADLACWILKALMSWPIVCNIMCVQEGILSVSYHHELVHRDGCPLEVEESFFWKIWLQHSRCASHCALHQLLPKIFTSYSSAHCVFIWTPITTSQETPWLLYNLLEPAVFKADTVLFAC